MTDIKTYSVTVTQRVKVTLDASKFDDQFLSGFREYMYPFKTIEDHACHLAQMKARGLYEMSSWCPTEFVEGYGDIGDMGISAEITDGDEEIEA